MANPKYTNRKLVVAYPGEFQVQPAFGTPIADGDINKRQAQATPAFHANVAFREELRSCDARFVIQEILTGKIARFTFAWSATAYLAAGWYAYLKGVAAAPTGSPADESQTLNLHGATSGHITLGLDFEGLSETSVNIATSAALTAATIKTALENLRPIKKGNVNVTGSAGGPFTITFQNKLAKANLPMLTLVDASTGGTGVTIASATNGANNLHAISATTSENPALFSLIEGYDGENLTNKFKDMVLDSWSVNLTRRGRMNLTVTAYGDPIPDVLSGYSMPTCDNPAPIHAKDCRIKIGSAYVGGDMRELTYTESNNIDVSEDAMSFDDITPDQLQAGDPTASLSALIIGSPTSNLYTFADDAPDDAFDTLELDLGVPGERLAIFAPHTQFRLDDGLQEYVGNRNVSAFRLLGRPSPDNSNIFTRGEYTGAVATQFLLT
jgi:hypothetical protein